MLCRTAVWTAFISAPYAQESYNGQGCGAAMQSISTTVNDVCCSPLSNCVDGTPNACTAACADAFVPFADACQQFVSAAGGGLEAFVATCQATQDGSGPSMESDVCPSGYLEHGDNCYLFSLDIAAYDVAEKACEALGGELACINNADENDFISQQLTGTDDYWIGFHDRSIEGTFEWSGGSCTSTYTNWLCTQFPCQEPNNAAAGLDGDGGSDCARMCPVGGSDGYSGGCAAGAWADFACTHENHYVCEIRGCPEGWKAHGSSCYLFSSDQLAHADASAACSTQGATLVHIDDAAENAFLASTIPAHGTDDYWIGLQSDGTWEGDGVAMDDSYTNWFTGEPNGSGQCVRMCPFGGSAGYSGGCTRGAWADYSCTTEYNYICERWWNDGHGAVIGGGAH